MKGGARIVAAGFLCCSLLFVERARAQTDNWLGSSSTIWNVAGNWSGGIPTASTTVSATPQFLLTVPVGYTAVASSVTLNNSTKLNISGTLNALSSGSFVEALNDSVVTVNAGGTLHSALVELGTNGDVLVNNGTLVTSELEILGGTSQAYLLGNTTGVTQLVIGSGGIANFGINQNGTATASTLSIGDLVSQGNVVIGAGTTVTLNVTNAANSIILGTSTTATAVTGSIETGVISGSGNLAVAGTGQITLSGVNTYTGTTAITNHGVVLLSGAGSIANSQSVAITTNGSLDASGASTTGVTLRNLSGDGTGTIVLGTKNLTVSETGATTFAGVIGGSGGLTLAGTGTLTLSGTNTYTGATSIGAGHSLALGGTNAIAASSNVVLNGALDISTAAGAQNVNNLSGSGTVTLGSKTLTIDETGGTTFGGAISGTGGLGVTGAGTGTSTLILSGNSTYTGATTLLAGTATALTVQVGNGGTTGTLGTGAVALGAGTTLAVNHAAGTSYTLAGALSGAGAFSQINGTTILTGADGGFTGASTVSGGILEVDGAYGSSAVAVSGGTLQGTGSITHAVNVTTGTLAAGTSSAVGTLTMGTLTLASGSTVVLREASNTHDTISAGGTTALAGTLEFILSGTATTLGANALNGITGTTTGSFGTVVIGGTGTLNLSGLNNSFTGALLVNQGATLGLTEATGLAIQNASSVTVNGALDASTHGQTLKNLSGSGSVALGSQTLNVSESNAATSPTTFSGTIGGTSGNLAVSGVGRLILSGNNTYTGTTVLSGTATVQVGNGGAAGTLGSGDVTVNAGTTLAFDHASATTATVANNISGTGALAQEGGTTVLTGTNSYSGTATVSGGTLEADSAFNAATVNVTGGTLRGNNTLAGNVNMTGGTLAAGTASTLGTLTINGNLTMNSGSAAAFRVTGPGVNDQVVVNGTATIAGTATFYVSGMTVRAGDTLNVIKVTNGAESGNFSSVTSGLANALLYKSQYDAATRYVQLVAYQGSFMPFAGNGNQSAVAANLNAVTSDARSTAVVDYLNALSGAQLGAAMNQIAPTPMTSFPAVLQASSDNVGQSISQRMGALRGGATGFAIENLDANTFFDAQSLLADNSDTAPIGYDTVPLFRFLAPVSTNRWGAFVSGLGTSGEVNDSDVPGYKYYAGGFQAGVDYRLYPNLVLGISGGYQHGQTDFDESGSQVQVDSGNAQLYSTWNDSTGDWVGGSLGGSYHWFDSKRDSLGGTASAKPEGTEIDANIEAGHDFTHNSWTMTPTLGLLYSRTMLDSFTETGSLTPLSVDSHSSDSVRSRLGVTVADSLPVGSIQLRPYVQAGWQHEYLDQSSSVTARFASGSGGVFNTAGPRIAADSATFGFGASTLITPAITATLGYFGQANSDYLESNIEGNVRYQF